MTKKTLSPREANRAARRAREDEIRKRWNERVALGFFEADLAGVRADEGSYLLMQMLLYAEWASLDRLVGMVPTSVRRELVVTALRLIQLKEMPYDEYLQTPEWRERATRCKERYGNRCALDAKHTADHAHHRTYERRGREYQNDLIPLCADCHAKHHDRRS